MIKSVNRKFHMFHAVFSWKIIVTAFFLAIAMRFFFIFPFRINYSNMRVVLEKENRRFLVNRIAYYVKKPERGDQIIYSQSDTQTEKLRNSLFGRIAGLPGETLYIEKQHVYVNGKRIMDSFLLNNNYFFNTLKNMKFGDPKDPVKIHDDQYFVLADSSEHLSDSRFFGCVDKKDIKGKVFFIYWPFKKFGAI